jgi:hypothetical protein
MAVLDRCYAIQSPVYGPAMRIITAITNANPAVVTTSFPHNYVTGTIVRLDIPPLDGMQQANQSTGVIVVLSPTTFAMSIDTTFYDVFAIPMAPAPTDQICAQVVPIGEDNGQLTAAVQNLLTSVVI